MIVTIPDNIADTRGYLGHTFSLLEAYCDIQILESKGVEMPIRKLALRWGWKRTKVADFLEKRTKSGQKADKTPTDNQPLTQKKRTKSGQKADKTAEKSHSVSENGQKADKTPTDNQPLTQKKRTKSGQKADKTAEKSHSVSENGQKADKSICDNQQVSDFLRTKSGQNEVKEKGKDKEQKAEKEISPIIINNNTPKEKEQKQETETQKEERKKIYSVSVSTIPRVKKRNETQTTLFPIDEVEQPKPPKADKTDTTDNPDTDDENKRFKPPTIQEIADYAKKQGIEKWVNAESLWAFYDSKNWMVGKNKMVRWRSAVSGWAARTKERNGNNNNTNQARGHRQTEAEEREQWLIGRLQRKYQE